MHGQWYPRQYPPRQPQPPQRVLWVASPPPGAMPVRYPRRRRPYSGPPSYPAPPRWGFPQLSWRWPTTVPGSQRAPANAESVRSAGKVAWLMVSVTGVTSVLAFLGEVLRYVLLVAGLSGPVSPGLVTFSDTLVIAAGLVTVVFALTSLVLTLRWLHSAREMSAGRSGRRPAHSGTRTVLSIIIPVWNLVGPLTVLTELEHAITERPAQSRPSKTVWTWWGCWLLSGALFTLTLIWGLRDSVQAIADGVLLHAITDVAAAVLAWQTARVISTLTALLAGAGEQGLRFRRLISAEQLPVTETRAPRPADAAR